VIDSTATIKRFATISGWASLAAVPFFAGYFIGDVNLMTATFTVIGIVGSSMLLIPNTWAICLLFGYLSFEGMAKLLVEYNPIVHVASDIIIVILCLRVFISFSVRKIHLPESSPPLFIPFILLTSWILISFVNPTALPWYASLAGAKLYLLPSALFFFGYYLNHGPKEIRRYMTVWILILLLETVTGLYQAAIGPTSVIHLSPQYAVALAKYSGPFRPFGTTAIPGNPSVLISIAMPFLLYFLVTTPRKWLKLTLSLLCGGAIVTMVFCQIRASMVKAIVASGVFLFFALSRSSINNRKQILITVAMGVALLSFFIPMLTNHWVDNTNNYSSAIDRSLTALDYASVVNARSSGSTLIWNYMEKLPLGAGLSRTGASAGRFGYEIGTHSLINYIFFTDNTWAAVIAELGIPGVLLLLIIIGAILIRDGAMVQLRYKFLSTEHSLLHAVMLGMLTATTIGFWGAEGLLYNPESSVFWFFSGVMLRIKTLDEQLTETAL
jgi:hypothetical protein